MAYIIFDLDDTLLNDERKISPYTLQVLHKLQSMGHKIIPNTARSKLFAQEYLDALKPDYAILNGGTLFLDKEERVVMRHMIDAETTKTLIKELLQHTDYIDIQTEDRLYSHLGQYTRQNAKAIDFSKEAFDFPAFKVVIKTFDEKMVEAIAEKFDLEVTSYFGGDIWRFNKKGGTKAEANRRLMEKLGGSLADVIAFGDDLGDLEMLQQAGIGVLMKNARKEVHGQVARMSEYTNDEDGVARFLVEHFGLEM